MSDPTDTAARILALGDSYTVGTAVAPEARWLDRVVRRLRNRNVDIADPTIIATNGWTTDDLSAAIDRRSPDSDYDLVTLLVGANDVFDGRTVTTFRPKYVDLLERAVEFAGGDSENALAITVPDYTLTAVGQENDPADHADRLAACNQAVRDVATERGVRVVDVVPISRQVRAEEGLIAEDGLHPSPAQHERWADLILPSVVDVLDE